MRRVQKPYTKDFRPFKLIDKFLYQKEHLARSKVLDTFCFGDDLYPFFIVLTRL